jgi:hypothetical protein
MTALGLIQTSLCVSFLATAAILLPIIHYQLYSHLRRQHRKASMIDHKRRRAVLTVSISSSWR